MSQKLKPIIDPVEPENDQARSFELSLGEQKTELPETARNAISVLVHESDYSDRSYNNIQNIVKGLIRPDPLFPETDRFLECLKVYEGLGVEGSFVEGKEGLHFAETHNGGLYVYPDNPEYVVFDFCINYGSGDYTDYHLGKRDKEGRGYIIENLQTFSLKEAAEKGADIIETGHRDPIPLPKDRDDETTVKFANGLTGKMRTSHDEFDPDADKMSWTCEVFATNGKSLATLTYPNEPTRVLFHVKHPDIFKNEVFQAREAEKVVGKDLDKKSDMGGMPF